MIYNFGAGPACLPNEVLNQIKADIPDWYEGMSIMELSHRAKCVMDLTAEIEADLRKVLSIPEEFAVLFMHGGARGQFSAIPLNCLHSAPVADYLITGMWSKLAYYEAEKYCQPNSVVPIDTLENTFESRIPDESTWQLSKNAPYLHYTDNETIQGLEFPAVPQITLNPHQWLICDMTSNILSRPIDFSRMGLIYASAQKNLGIAGITVVIVRKSLLGKAHPLTPSIFDYKNYYESHSLYNTAPVFCWYVLGLVVKWFIKNGGMPAFEASCAEKSRLVYDVIDHSDFYTNPVFKPHRSRINIPFRLPTEALETLFDQQAWSQGLKQLKGHKAVGGLRASLYNAMPMSGVKDLVDFMKHFEKTHG